LNSIFVRFIEQVEIPVLRRVWAEGAAVGDSANVTRPSGSFFIWQNPKSTLHHPLHLPLHRHRWLAYFECQRALQDQVGDALSAAA
jgi:hypothetical protein